MPIEEGSPNNGMTATTIADAIVQANQRMAQQSQGAQPSKFRQHLDALAKTGEDGANQAAGTEVLFNAFEEELTGKFANKTEQMIAKRLFDERNNQSIKFVDDALDQYIGADDDLKNMKSVMKQAIIQEWQNAPELQSHRERYDRGDVDYGKLRELALKQVDSLNKFRKVDGGKERSASGMTNSGSSSGTRGGSESEAPRGSTYKFEDMHNEKEKGIWSGAMDVAQKRGMNHRSEEAHKFASSFIDTFRNSVAKRRKEPA